MKLLRNIFLGVLTIQVLLLQNMSAATWVKDLFHPATEGLTVMFVVNTGVIENHLNEYYEKNPDTPRLFVPETPPATGLVKGDAYIGMAFAYASGPELFDLTPTTGTMSLFIPHLAASPGGVARYSLLLGEFVEGDLPGFTSVEEISIGADFIRVKNHGEKIDVAFHVASPCVTPPTQVRHEFEDEILKSSLLGDNVLLKLGECEGVHATEIPEHCSKMAAIFDDVVAEEPNVCVVTVINSEETCDATVDEITITKEFRDMLVADGVELVAAGAEKYKGDFSTGMIYPCIV